MSNESATATDLLGTVFDPAGVLAYQNDAIVSRTIVEKPDTTVTVFAVDAGQSISEHSAPHEAMIQVVDGEASITVADETHTVSAGEALLIPADAPHALRAEKRFKMMLTMAR